MLAETEYTVTQAIAVQVIFVAYLEEKATVRHCQGFQYGFLPKMLSLSTKFVPAIIEHSEDWQTRGKDLSGCSPREARRDRTPTKIHTEWLFVQQCDISRIIHHNLTEDGPEHSSPVAQ
ncbi:hypothetical protein ACP4OV_021670 [Aristida adscensionis]